jgi:hypothetical protein
MAATTAQNAQIFQRIESFNSTPYAGQTVTLSVWAKNSAGTSKLSYVGVYPSAADNWGGSNTTDVQGDLTATSWSSSWTRYSVTFTMNALATRGYQIIFYRNGTETSTTLYAGAQLEIGSVATNFTRTGGTIQGELSACQRYYYRFGGLNAYQGFGLGYAKGTTTVQFPLVNPVTMRISPTSIDYSTLTAFDGTSFCAISAIASDGLYPNICRVAGTTTGATQYRPYELLSNNSTSGYIGFSAEL